MLKCDSITSEIKTLKKEHKLEIETLNNKIIILVNENTWAKEMGKLLLEIKKEKEECIAKDKKNFSESKLKEYENKYEKILKIGFEQNKKIHQNI